MNHDSMYMQQIISEPG